MVFVNRQFLFLSLFFNSLRLVGSRRLFTRHGNFGSGKRSNQRHNVAMIIVIDNFNMRRQFALRLYNRFNLLIGSILILRLIL